MSKGILLTLFALTAIGGILFYPNFFKNRVEIPVVPVEKNNEIPRLLTIAANLEVPWALVFLPDRSILFTERPGRVRFIDNKSNLISSPIAFIDGVLAEGEGGLLGVTIHPDFAKNHFVYVYYTYSQNNNETLNRVVRFKFKDNSLSEKTIIVDKIPGALFHNGGRIKFGPDEFLYITTGDSQNPSLSQNKNSRAGKILRVNSEGKNLTVISYGHRNPQGIAWDDKGNLWETEHGQSATDELNLIEMNGNYGWPVIRGNQLQSGMESAIIHSGNDTWAPAGAAYLNSSIFFAGLRGQALFEYNIASKVLIPHLKGEIGRIREVVLGPDNLLYITTSNRDGRGVPDSTDDKIIRVNPSKL